MTVCRLLLVLAVSFALLGCGGDWPDLAPEPGKTIPAGEPQAEDDAAVAPEGPAPQAVLDAETLSRAIVALQSRLSQYRNSFADLTARIDDGLAAITPEQATGEEAWATAQLRLSRLSVLRGDLSRLFESAQADAARILRLQSAMFETENAGKTGDRLDALGRDVAGFLDRVETRHNRFKMALARLEAALADVRPAAIGESAAAGRLPAGPPVMTIAAETGPARYRDAVATLVDRAETVRPDARYRVVAAGDAAAQEKGRAVLSLLGTFGVAPERSDAVVDLSADPGTVRVFVE